MSHARALAKQIQSAAGTEPIEFGMILGSGLSQLIDKVEGTAVPYADLDGFATPTVSGHDPRLLVGCLFDRRVAILGGRSHYYENGDPAAMRLPIEVLHELGAKKLIVTSAAGSMRSDIPPGELMLVSDHINFSGLNPLIGEATDKRFVPMCEAYDVEMREALKAAAREEGLILNSGVYAWYSGPSYETPAEIRAILNLGADAVGMATVPEVIIGRFLGMRTVAISVITNMAAGMSHEAISHEHTKEVASHGVVKLERLLARFLTQG